MGQARKLGTKKRVGKSKPSPLEGWMISRLSSASETATIALDRLRVREAINIILYQLDNDIAWYKRRLGPKKLRSDNRDRILRKVLETRMRMMAPLAPHTAEEIWSRIGNKGFVVQTDWPEESESDKDPTAERAETLVRQVLDDTGEILKATGITPKRIAYYTAADWKWQGYLKALNSSGGKRKEGELLTDVIGGPGLRSLGKIASDYAAKAVQQANPMPDMMRPSRFRDCLTAASN